MRHRGRTKAPPVFVTITRALQQEGAIVTPVGNVTQLLRQHVAIGSRHWGFVLNV